MSRQIYRQQGSDCLIHILTRTVLFGPPHAPSRGFTQRRMRDFHAPERLATGTDILSVPHIKSPLYRGFSLCTAKRNFFAQSTFEPLRLTSNWRYLQASRGDVQHLTNYPRQATRPILRGSIPRRASLPQLSATPR